MKEKREGLKDDENFPICWRCGHFDFGPCSDGTLLCNGCDAVWHEVPARMRKAKETKPCDATERRK